MSSTPIAISLPSTRYIWIQFGAAYTSKSQNDEPGDMSRNAVEGDQEARPSSRSSFSAVKELIGHIPNRRSLIEGLRATANLPGIG
jgi:hypothetical protein